ncbi:MAG: hypothetical protein IPO80_04875 [Propionibacteriaceae bacterium]|nr:hypothetical protein [Propionibacteriaceae bacterium]
MRIAAPNTQASLILAAVGQVAAAPIKRARLAEYLTVHPEALTSGDSGSPKAVGHLIHALTAAGVAGWSRPLLCLRRRAGTVPHP